MKLIPFHRDDVISYLRNHTVPVMEADMLKQLAGLQNLPGNSTELFLYHFSLFHSMYNLKEELSLQGFYLHMNTMRLRLVPYPPQGHCYHYDDDQGAFCSEPCNSNYCPEHMPLYAKDLRNPYFDNMRDFYINEENISFGESDLLEKLMNGVIVYAFHKGEIEHALKFFGLTHPNKKIIQKKYHHLALKFHPDRNGGDEKNMTELNQAYQVLKEVYLL